MMHWRRDRKDGKAEVVPAFSRLLRAAAYRPGDEPERRAGRGKAHPRPHPEDA